MRVCVGGRRACVSVRGEERVHVCVGGEEERVRVCVGEGGGGEGACLLGEERVRVC